MIFAIFFFISSVWLHFYSFSLKAMVTSIVTSLKKKKQMTSAKGKDAKNVYTNTFK